MRGAIHPLPQYAFMAWCSVEALGQLYLYLYLLDASNNENKAAKFLHILFSSTANKVL
jgi:hypothetical protein